MWSLGIGATYVMEKRGMGGPAYIPALLSLLGLSVFSLLVAASPAAQVWALSDDRSKFRARDFWLVGFYALMMTLLMAGFVAGTIGSEGGRL